MVRRWTAPIRCMGCRCTVHGRRGTPAQARSRSVHRRGGDGARVDGIHNHEEHSVQCVQNTGRLHRVREEGEGTGRTEGRTDMRGRGHKCETEPPGVAPQTAVKGSSTFTRRHLISRKSSQAQSQSSDVVRWVLSEDACEKGFGVPRARRGAQTEGAPLHHQPADMQSGSPQRSYPYMRARRAL